MKNFSIIFNAKLGSPVFVGIHQSFSQKRRVWLFFLISQSKTKKSECRSDWCLWLSTNIYFVKLWQTLWKIICNWKKKEFIDQLVIIRLHIMANPPLRKVDCIKNLNLIFMISLKPGNKYWYTGILTQLKKAFEINWMTFCCPGNWMVPILSVKIGSHVCQVTLLNLPRAAIEFRIN